MIRSALIWLCASLSLGPAALAQTTQEMTEIRNQAAIDIRPDRTYFLFRNDAPFGPALLRIPTDNEMHLYDTFQDSTKNIRNLQIIDMGKPYQKFGRTKIFLIEALPGDYVLYGFGWRKLLYTCLCLGTVSFSGQAGEIVDLGTLLVAEAFKPSDIPELASVTNMGPSMNGFTGTLAAAIRPAIASIHLPSQLADKAIVPAKFRATGKFIAEHPLSINRLVPIPGILGYDRGVVLDLQTNSVAPDQY
jgi:hypothetical protein